MKLASTNFKDGGKIEIKLSCQGEGILPNLSWDDFPCETESFAIIVEDPDAPSGKFVHWIVVNIPPTTTLINEGDNSIVKAKEIPNSAGKTIYIPPCPPTGIHRYYYKIFALSTDKIEGINKDNFYEKIKPYVIDEAILTGKYGK